MDRFLNSIRKPVSNIPISKQLLFTLLFLFVGAASGTLTKFLDEWVLSNLPDFLTVLDLQNLFGSYAFWILASLSIAVFSRTPIRAGINVFAFYAGMLTGSYAVAANIIGVSTGSDELMSRMAFLIIAPFAAFVCWYAKGKGVVSIILAALIAALMFHLAFSYGWLYFAAKSILNVVMWIASFAILYKGPKQIMLVLLISLLFAVVFYFIPMPI